MVLLLSPAISRSGAIVATTAGALFAARIVVGAAFAWHSCRVVFNRSPPISLSALRGLLGVTRPLGIVWRALTAPLRTLPDVYVLGEVRCGTTSLASMLRDRLGMAGPFTPWDHPLANAKESFYFVGHYWRVVSPALYRLCFPFRISRWYHRVVLRQPLLVFDGCASHLSAPWAPALVRRATPRPLLIVCLREPVSQHVSWWKLEQSGMAWGDAMGLGPSYLPPPSRLRYPPRSLREAVCLSRSPEVTSLWERAGEARTLGDGPLEVLPEWAAPFPNGQLSAFDHMGRYADSIQRWRREFAPGCFLFLSLEEISTSPSQVLAQISDRCAELGHTPPAPAAAADAATAAPRAAAAPAAKAAAAPRLNESLPLPPHLEPDAELLRELGAYYRPHNERLFALIGRDLGWHSDERYWWYR